MFRSLGALALIAASVTPALARDPELLLGQNHAGVDLGLGILSFNQTDLYGVSAVVQGRFAIGTGLGLDVRLPLGFVTGSTDGTDISAFDLGNPSVVFEIENRIAEGMRVFGFGIGLPVASVPDGEGALDSALDYHIATFARGASDVVLWTPARFSVLADMQARYRFHPLFIEGAATIAGLFSIEDEDPMFNIGGWAHFGIAIDDVIPLLGVSFSWTPTEDRDPIAVGVRLGVMAEVGDFELQLIGQYNIEPRTAFDDGGVFGIRVGMQQVF